MPADRDPTPTGGRSLPPPAGPGWRTSATHRAWLDVELRRLVTFSADPRHPLGGFGELDDVGRVSVERPVHTWITGRMTHVHALAHLVGIPGSGHLVDHGIAGLAGLLHDDAEGGWFAAVDADGSPDTTKDAYQHAFVVLAAASATAAGREGASELLDLATEVFATRFWDDRTGRFVESFDRAWTTSEPYRSANSNMHGVEASLAIGDVTGDPIWHDRALRVATGLIDDVAREQDRKSVV